MKIRKIEYENFRNFKDHGEIKCSTDGKVTIIYGKNGEGKTTLHQLFQWILYGEVHFNKTTSNILYNLKAEEEQIYGDTFQVLGRIDFEHEGEEYSLTRKNIYQKGMMDSEKLAEEVYLNKMFADNDWRRLDDPDAIIEKFLPSGLSDYFFFDGENMIADLRVKGKDSANKLKEALYSMFDLDVIEAAMNHIGRTDLKTTALGKLYLSKGNISSGGEIAALKTNVENAENRIHNFEEDQNWAKAEKEKLSGEVKRISEEIGNTKSKKEYEEQRRNLKKNRDTFLENAKEAQASFGAAVMDMFPQLFISKAVIDAKEKLHLKIGESKLPTGVTKALINYLLKDSTTTCVCGNPLGENEKEKIKEYLDLLPPKSYKSLYDEFSKTAKAWGNGYDRDRIENYIKLVLSNNEQAAECEVKIKELDQAEKTSKDIEKLITDRTTAENKIDELEKEISDRDHELKKLRVYLKKKMDEFNDATKETEAGKQALKKIEIMESVYRYFNEKLELASKEYSEKLEKNIQGLLDDMLGKMRTVTVSNDFAVTVTDSHRDESKSEGQFAVVSFAYIGGILKMLRAKRELSSKEYPLVLDGPFSKLDEDYRQNVVNALPQFAPQVIIFSKDDLHEVFDKENIGRVWTIQSNDEKNIASVKEGHLW